MKLTATLNGQNVTVVAIQNEGLVSYISYIDASGNLKVERKEIRSMSADLAAILATSCTAVS